MPPLFSSPAPEAFQDRVDAGRQLAAKIRPRVERLPADDVVTIGLARGGVIVAAEVARQLDTRLEAIVVRKLGAPGQPELALGALTASGDRALNQALIHEIGLSEEDLQRIVDNAREDARRLCEELGAPATIPDIKGKTAILVDDGMATGATMRVAIQSAYNQGARHVIVALPVAPDTAVESLREIADDVVILVAPSHLRAVGQWYQSFLDVPTQRVRETLQENPHRLPK